MRIQETAVAVDDLATYGEELTDTELTQVSGGVYHKEGGCTDPRRPDPQRPKPKLGGVVTTEV